MQEYVTGIKPSQCLSGQSEPIQSWPLKEKMRPVPVQGQTSLKKNTDGKKQQNESVSSQESIKPQTKIAKTLHHPTITKFGSTLQSKQSETPQP